MEADGPACADPAAGRNSMQSCVVMGHGEKCQDVERQNLWELLVVSCR